MSKIIEMPRLAVAMEEGLISTWHKEEGDRVEEGELLVEIETEKAANDYESPAGGIVYKILCEEGDSVPVETPICILIDEGEEVDEDVEKIIENHKKGGEEESEPKSSEEDTEKKEEKSKQKSDKVKVIPAARKLADENDINLHEVNGTGPGGLITVKDINAFIDENNGSDTVEDTSDELKVKDTIKLSGVRGTIAKRMKESFNQAPQGTQFMEIDMEQTIKLKEVMQSIYAKEEVKISFTALFIKECALILAENPLLNSLVNEENGEIKVIENINIGVAVGMDEGLYVPVIKNVQNKNIKQIAEELANFSERAKNGSLSTDEMQDATFTVTNLGMFNVSYFTPLIDLPQSAILGCAKIDKKPVVIDDKIEIRPVSVFSLTLDHRSVDGVPAAKFFYQFKELLETDLGERIQNLI